MAESAYQRAVTALTDAFTITDTLSAWAASKDARVCANIQSETALKHDDFCSLLRAFSDGVASGAAARDAWVKACRDHKLRGAPLPEAHCPMTLGRAMSMESFAQDIAVSSRGALSPGEALNLLRKRAGETRLGSFEPFVRDAPLGRYLIWATFNHTGSGISPFASLPRTRAGVLTALGLGPLAGWSTIVTLTWAHAPPCQPSLHRPTVADAEAYPYYRPNPDPTARWGLTSPLEPNPENLEPRPEVVLKPIHGTTLQLPYHAY